MLGSIFVIYHINDRYFGDACERSTTLQHTSLQAILPNGVFFPASQSKTPHFCLDGGSGLGCDCAGAGASFSCPLRFCFLHYKRN